MAISLRVASTNGNKISGRVWSDHLWSTSVPALADFTRLTPQNEEPKFVQHMYTDHSRDEIDELNLSKELLDCRDTTMTSAPFPVKLHRMLESADADGHSHLVSWAPHGTAFVVKKPKEFLEVVLCKYFNQSKCASFQRQLNMYGFTRLTKGPDARGYYHELFLRNRPLLARKIERFPVKGTIVRYRANPDQEPNFYEMAPPPADEEHQQPSLHQCKETLCPSKSSSNEMAFLLGIEIVPVVEYQASSLPCSKSLQSSSSTSASSKSTTMTTGMAIMMPRVAGPAHFSTCSPFEKCVDYVSEDLLDPLWTSSQSCHHEFLEHEHKSLERDAVTVFGKYFHYV